MKLFPIIKDLFSHLGLEVQQGIQRNVHALESSNDRTKTKQSRSTEPDTCGLHGS